MNGLAYAITRTATHYIETGQNGNSETLCGFLTNGKSFTYVGEVRADDAPRMCAVCTNRMESLVSKGAI